MPISTDWTPARGSSVPGICASAPLDADTEYRQLASELVDALTRIEHASPREALDVEVEYFLAALQTDDEKIDDLLGIPQPLCEVVVEECTGDPLGTDCTTSDFPPAGKEGCDVIENGAAAP